MLQALRDHPLSAFLRSFTGARPGPGFLAAWACGVAMLLLSGGSAMAQVSTENAEIYEFHTGPVPVGAVIYGNRWRCRDGYALGAGGQCDPVVAPANGVVVANGWRCMPGFKKEAEACARLVAPPFGFIRGNAIECNACYSLKVD